MAKPSDEKATSPDRSERDALIRDYKTSFKRYALDCLRIVTKDGRLEPLDLNYTQKKIVSAIGEARARGNAPRLVVLKSRQVGCSTLAEALIFWSTHLWAHRSGLVLTHKEWASKNLFRMTRRYLKNLPENLRPKAKFDNVREIQFDHDSRVQVETSGDARSYTAQFCHISELGFIENAKETLTAVLQTVPNTVDSLVILESTANGAGNEFHRVWQRAVHGEGDARLHGLGFIPIFIPWFKHAEYRMKPWFSLSDTTPEERVLMHRFSLELSAIAWRRWCVDTNCGGDEEKFQVEYPATPAEAFLLSGRPAFNPQAVSFYAARLKPKELLPKPCEIDWDEEAVPPAPTFAEADRGRLVIFRDPIPRHSYILGADPSEGDQGSDPTPLCLLDQMTLSPVAEWYGKAPPDLLADYAFALGWHFNKALIVGEANNHGILFHARLLARGYPNVYFRNTSEDSVANRVTLKPGWYQSTRNKHFLVDTGRRFVREKFKLYQDKDIMLIESPRLLKQIESATYVRKEHEMEAKIVPNDEADPDIAHLDLLMAWLLTLGVHRGTAESPLEPLPVALLTEAATQAMLMRERDPQGADAFSVDITGMTCDELMRVLERRNALLSGSQGGPLSGMA